MEDSGESIDFVGVDDKYHFLFKIVLIGDAGVGKTCVVQRFKHGIYIERHGNTIGVDFMLRTVDIDGKKIKVRKHTAFRKNGERNFVFNASELSKVC